MKHEIWVQGHKAGIDIRPATLYATVEAESFDEALDTLIENDETFARHYDRQTHKFWGCLVFGDESKARERYG